MFGFKKKHAPVGVVFGEWELENELKRLGIWEQFSAGSCRCAGCKRRVTITNIGMISVKQGKPRLYHRDSACTLRA